MGGDGGGDCVACGAGTLRPWRVVRSFDPRATQPCYRLSRCDRCGSAVTAGLSGTEAALLHRGGSYATPSAPVDRLLEPMRRLGDLAALSALGAVPPGARVLDLGAGDGRMLRLLRRRGCAVEGVDAFVGGEEELDVRRERLEEASVEPGGADVVLLWHVLEHVADPAHAIGVAARALGGAGNLVVSVPVLDSVQARVGGDRWFHLDVPRHTVHFTRAGLRRLLERCGFRVVRTRGATVDQNLLGMAQTLLNLITRERNVGFRALKGDRSGVPLRDLAVTAAAAAPATIAAVVAESAAMLAGGAGAFVVHAIPADA